MSTRNRLAAEFLRDQLEMDGVKTSALSNIFTSEPPPLKTFLYDSKYLNHLRPTKPFPDTEGYAFTLSPIQFDFVRNFEQVFRPELYIAMVEEFGPEWAPLPMKNLFAAAWGKGSKDPDELVYNAEDGSWVKLRDFKAGPVASSYAEDGKVFVAQGTDSFKEGEGRMFTVTTQSGRKVKVWEGHRFLAWGREHYPSGVKVRTFSDSKDPQWKRLWDLKVGDHIAISSTLPEPANPLTLEDWEVEWLGLMIGDGCMTTNLNKGGFNHSLTVGYQSPKTLQHCLDLIEVQGPKCRVRDDGRKLTLYPSHGVGSKGKFHPLKDLLSRFGLAGSNAYTKHIPSELFKLNNRQVALLLSRLIDTDGWVSLGNTVEVGYGTVSEKLADDVVNLFLRLGVVAEKKLKKGKYQGKDYYSYQVRVRRQRFLRKLLPHLTLLDKEEAKQKALEWLNEDRGGSDFACHGDLMWDRIKSIEYEGWGDYWTLTVDGPASYISSGGVLDHNSGKDTTVRIGFIRVASLLQHMVSPQSYFNMAATDEIHFLNVAASAAQARMAFFDPMKRVFMSNEYLSSMFHGDDPADGSNTIRLKNNVRIISGHSLAETQEGLSLLASCADEISAFKVAEEFKSRGEGREARGAAQIVDFLRSSGSSRFPHTYKMAQISWPRFHGDAIEKAVAQGNDSIKKMGDKSPWYVSGPHPTWEVKPGVTKEDFAQHFEENPEKASAMYGCKPPRTKNAFIRDSQAIDAAFSNVVDMAPIEVEYYWGLPPKNTVLESDSLTAQEGWQVQFTFSDDLVPVEGALYCLHGDMAIVGDRAGVAMSHVRTYETGTSEEEERPIVKNDFVFAFESDLTDEDHPREVQIRWYRQLIWELVERGFEIVTCTFDGWQSVDIIQSLQAVGIEAGLLSLDRNDRVYQNFKDIILDFRLESYRVGDLTEFEGGEPLVVQEVKKLRRVGKKIDHLPGQSKDLSDALAGSVWNAVEVGGQEDSSSLDDSLSYTQDTSFLLGTQGRNKGPGSIMDSNPWGFNAQSLNYRPRPPMF